MQSQLPVLVFSLPNSLDCIPDLAAFSFEASFVIVGQNIWRTTDGWTF